MSLRILHSAHMRTPMIGVIRQMEYEQQAADELGISWHTRMVCNDHASSPVTVSISSDNRYRAFKQAYYRWLEEQIPSYDLIMLRYAKNDPYQYRFAKNCPIPLVTMHHTMEVYELIGNGSVRSRALAALEQVLGRLTLKHVNAIACVTDQIGEHQRNRSRDQNKPIIHYGNGAVYGDDPVLAQQLLTAQNHKFIFLSSEFPVWMGLDLLFEAAQKCNRDFELHIVGRLTADQQALISQDARFVAHGFMNKKEVDELMAQCTLGLSTFGIHRKRFTEGNTLKSREYLRAGLPVYAGHRDIFEDTFPYHRDGAADFEAILAYADEMINVDRRTVSEAARPLIEKKRLLAKMYQALHHVTESAAS